VAPQPVLPPRDDLDRLVAQYDDEAWRGVEASAAAELRGDAEQALEIHLAGPRVPGSLREHVLREVVWLGEQAPSWIHARWIVKQAYRSLLLSDDGDRIDEALHLTIGAVYADVDPQRPLGWEGHAFVNHLISSDWVCMELAAHELGGLAVFLAERAAPALVDRGSCVGEWAHSAVGGYRLTDIEDDVLHVVDLLTGRPLALLNLGAARCRDPETCVIGRVVPIEEEPGLMFESRPLSVDDTTAEQVAGSTLLGPMAWVGVLAEARADGRLPAGFSLCLPTSLVCDVPGGPPAGISGVGGAGDAAVALCDFVLDQVAADCDMAGFVAPVLLGVLLDPASFAVIRERCTAPPRQQAWRAIAAACYSPFRERCDELATLCDWRPAA
jgi:hypothetical protein